MKKSSIEQLFDEIFNIPFNTPEAEDLYSEIMDLKEKYKEMHKQEIIEAHESGVGCIDYGYGIEFYNETYEKEN